MRTPKLETITTTVKATALISELIFASQVVKCANPQHVISSRDRSEFTEALDLRPNALNNLSIGEPQPLSFREPEREWSSRMEKQFEKLAIAEALSTISPQDKLELEQLTAERRRLHHPRSAEEILFEYRQRQVTSNLVKAVEEYVRFHDLSHKARATTA
jgi:hypothetical protein